MLRKQVRRMREVWAIWRSGGLPKASSERHDIVEGTDV